MVDDREALYTAIKDIQNAAGYKQHIGQLQIASMAEISQVDLGKIMNTPSPSCLMMWDPFDSVYADATFSKDYLPQWREILSNIQKILDGQMVKGD
ncbi:MAG: hypothetical protein P8171_26075 [Candidatus Thiodiazotropha sp.]